MQISDLVLFLTSFFLTASFILFLYPISIKLNLLDHPGGRKKHVKPVPLIGGIAIFLSLTTTFVIHGDFFYTEIRFLWVASCILCLACIIDDKSPLTHNLRFLFQAVALTLVIFMGDTEIRSLGWMFGSKECILGFISVPFTYFAVIGVINAVNMSDGIDGLASSLGLTQSASLLYYASQIGATQEVIVILVITGGLSAFLIFNFPSKISNRLKVFLGDAGSMLLGFVLAWLCVRLGQPGQRHPAVLMLWVMALPIMDTIYLIINRCIRGVSPFKSDRRHLHHILCWFFSERQTVIIISISSLFLGFLGFFLYKNTSELVMFVWFLVLFIVYFYMSYCLRRYAKKRPETFHFIA